MYVVKGHQTNMPAKLFLSKGSVVLEKNNFIKYFPIVLQVNLFPEETTIEKVLINTLFHVTGLQQIPALVATAPIMTDGMTRITALTAPTTDKTWACLPDLTDNTL